MRRRLLSPALPKRLGHKAYPDILNTQRRKKLSAGIGPPTAVVQQSKLATENVERWSVVGQPVCTENLSSGVVVVKSAKDGV